MNSDLLVSLIREAVEQKSSTVYRRMIIWSRRVPLPYPHVVYENVVFYMRRQEDIGMCFGRICRGSACGCRCGIKTG